MNYKGPWIGVDLDGTLAKYDTWRGKYHIGEPIPAMVTRIKGWIESGKRVKIFTARVAISDKSSVTEAIQDWLKYECGLPSLEVTCVKDMEMIELWDDRAVSVMHNSGAWARIERDGNLRLGP